MNLVPAFAVLVSGLLYVVVTAQDDGRYRPPTTTTTPRPFTRYRPYRPFEPFNQYRFGNDGRYTGKADGRYVARNDGRYYGGNDGRYVPGNDGRYVHVGDGDRGRYSHVEGPSGSSASRQGPSGSSSGGQGPQGGGAPAPTEAPAPTDPPSPAFVPTTSVPALAQRAQVRVAPRTSDSDGWKIIRLENQVRGDGYQYIFETENGINAEESGRIESDGKGAEGLRSTGFYEYVGDDGQVYRVDYVADTNGFLPRGDHIPKVPPAIEKLLAYLASQPK